MIVEVEILKNAETRMKDVLKKIISCCFRIIKQFSSLMTYGPPHMAGQKQDDQL